VFAEELPDRRPEVPGTIAVRTRIGIPIFVAPRGNAVVGALAPTVGFEAGHAVVTVRPAGALHVKLATVTIRALTGGMLRWHHEVNGWYVLPGQVRRFPVELGSDTCAGVDEVVAEIVGEDGTRWTGPPAPCR
jgi:P pilus assembly chaperone PapD